jgi:hypothetical protein
MNNVWGCFGKVLLASVGIESACLAKGGKKNPPSLYYLEWQIPDTEDGASYGTYHLFTNYVTFILLQQVIYADAIAYSKRRFGAQNPPFLLGYVLVRLI